MAPEFTSPAQIAQWLRAQASHPDWIVSAKLLCEDASPQRAICIIDVERDYANTLAAEIGGYVFGYSTVTVSLALADGFTCKLDAARGAGCSCWLVGGPG